MPQATVVTMQNDVLKDSPVSATFIAALIAALTSWENTEERSGRRGEYFTTGANSLRLREVDAPMVGTLCATLNGLGVDVDEEELTTLFNGQYEFQISFAANRFTSKSRQGLTATEMRTIQRVAEIATDPKKREQVIKALRAA